MRERLIRLIHRTARITYKTHRQIRSQRQHSRLDFGFYLPIGESVVPTRREKWQHPGGGSEALKLRLQTAIGPLRLTGDGWIGAVPGQLEPVERLPVLFQHVAGEAEFQHHVVVEGIAFMNDREVLQRIFQIAGLVTFFGQLARLGSGIARLQRLLAAAEYLRHLQSGSHAVSQFLIHIAGGQHFVQQRTRGRGLAALHQQKRQLRGRHHVVRRVFGDLPEFAFGLRFLTHFQQQISEFTTQFDVGWIERDGRAKFVDVRVAGRQQQARRLGGPCLGAARSGQQGGDRLLGPAGLPPRAAQVHEQTPFGGLDAPGGVVVIGRQRPIVAQFGQPRHFFMRAEIAGPALQRLLPSREAFGQGPVHILKSLLSGSARGGIARRGSHAIEDQPRHSLLAGLVGQEGEFQRYVVIVGIQPHRFGKLISRRFRLTDFQPGVGQVLANVDALGRQLRRAAKTSDGGVIVSRAQALVGLV